MPQVLLALLKYLLGFVRSRHDLGLEILALRQQLAVFKAAASTALPQALRPALLGGAVLPLGSMARRAHHRQAGNRCPLASRRVRPLLALPLARPVAGPAKDRAQRLRTGQAHGRGESFLGCAENPWRAVETGP